MGNRSSRSANKRRVTHNSDGTDGNIKSSTVSSAGAPQQQVPGQTDVNGGRELQVNIYRSYSQAGDGAPRRFKPAAPTTDFKVYRRSARPHAMTAANRSMSLPRSFGRTQRLADQSDVATMPRLKSEDTRPIARSSSRASNISTTLTSYKGVCMCVYDGCHESPGRPPRRVIYLQVLLIVNNKTR